MTTPTPDVLLSTRESLHRVAEHLLAATRKRSSGQISLVPAPGGFATPVLPDGRTVGVSGTDLVVTEHGIDRRTPLTGTLAEAAARAGLEPGFPWTKHPPGTPFEPDATLTVDAAAAALLADWFALGREALDALRAETAAEDPSEPQIFPEHFDLGMTAGGVNYGFSPGDQEIPEPYAYVGPHTPPAPDPFWNASFGAFRTHRGLGSPTDAVAFFRAARTVLARTVADA